MYLLKAQPLPLKHTFSYFIHHFTKSSILIYSKLEITMGKGIGNRNCNWRQLGSIKAKNAHEILLTKKKKGRT